MNRGLQRRGVRKGDARKKAPIRPSCTILTWLVLSTMMLMGATSAGVASGQTQGAWRSLKSGTTQPLYSVSCFNAMRCKAVGAGGTILYTKNGGATWREQGNPLQGSDAVLYRIACVAPSTCYVIARPNLIMVTQNGGATWSIHIMLIPIPAIDANFKDPSCLLTQSFDNRSNLTVCRVGLLDISCVTASTCFVVATPNAVWMTNDGGARWTKQVIPPTVPCNGDCGPKTYNYPLEWVSCLGTGLCRAGGSILIGSHEGFADAVIETSRPGTTWRVINDNNSSFSPDAAKCPTPTRCYGVYSSSPFEPGVQAWISTDGGAIWQSKPSGSSRVRNDIACPTATTCYTVGNQGTITGTTNGTDFTAQSSPTTRDLYAIKCLTATTCYAVGNKGAIVARR